MAQKPAESGPVTPQDPEFTAMRRINGILAKLNAPSRVRVLTYAQARAMDSEAYAHFGQAGHQLASTN
jgi:hypothetical protein